MSRRRPGDPPPEPSPPPTAAGVVPPGRPVTPARIRQVRTILVVASLVLAAGLVLTSLRGHGLWLTGVVGWVAVVGAAGLGAGRATLLVAIGVAPPPGAAAGSDSRAAVGAGFGPGPDGDVSDGDFSVVDDGWTVGRLSGADGGPAPAVDAFDTRLATALRALLADLTTSGVPRPHVTAGPPSAGEVTVVLRWTDGDAPVLAVRAADTEAERLADLAEQVQRARPAAVTGPGAGTAIAWPVCRRHPGAHPLAASVRRRRAVWVCPQRDSTVAEIGSLPDPFSADASAPDPLAPDRPDT
jgi:hypothetical protein